MKNLLIRRDGHLIQDVPFEPIQYQVLTRCTRAILAHYPTITPGRITCHSDIAPGRKTDPGLWFDWGATGS